MSAESHLTVHRFDASLFPVNAYLVETKTGVVVVDATLGVSDGRALRARFDALKKPLAAVIIRHSHPDHYGGVKSLLDETNVPIYAVAGVEEVIRRDDAWKEQILRPMFGDEWAAVRTFPNRITLCAFEIDQPVIEKAIGQERLHVAVHQVADKCLRWAIRLEAPHTIVWRFAWPEIGHREHRVSDGDPLASVTAAMKEFLPSDDLLFLMRLSVEPMGARLALRSGERGTNVATPRGKS